MTKERRGKCKYSKHLSYILAFSVINCLFTLTTFAQSADLDVLHYHLTLEPDIQAKSVQGSVRIRFESEGTTITLDAGDLQVDSVSGSGVVGWRQLDARLLIKLSAVQPSEREVQVTYHGSPRRGLLFDPERNEAHTVYFTDHWMICHNIPDDRATFSLDLVLPKGLQSVASGDFIGKEERGDRVIHQWRQGYETPPYTYGFVMGAFAKVTEHARGTTLHYLSSQFDERQLQQVFAETPAIIQFFEEKTGIPYGQETYSQVLIGSNYQEMSGLAVFNTTYGAAVMKDSSEIHLTSHELAHQWWGNRITCRDFGHFWLNEAFAVYMASAFHQVRFGEAKYLSDIAIYKSIYDDLVQRGKDWSLIFEQWQPTRINRNIVYYKGAYVLHLLRQEVGDDAFWKGIRLYTQRHFGQSVVTDDFQVAMEEATGSDLQEFFEKWVY